MNPNKIDKALDTTIDITNEDIAIYSVLHDNHHLS